MSMKIVSPRKSGPPPGSDRTKELTFGRQSGPKGCILFATDPMTHRQSFLRLTEGTALIGRDEVCDVVIRHDSVSRKHVRVTVEENGILVTDLASTNGTKFLGKKIGNILLHQGSRITVGEVNVDILPLGGQIPPRISRRQSYGGLYGGSLAMRRVFAVLEMLENSDAPVLIEGESGTGKELVARALHDHGRRHKRPFVVIDCAGVPENLIESELFGHVKGAFTGALADRVGAFESADGGTVFLDEVDELPLGLQPKLLRILETGQIRRLGTSRYSTVDIRVVAAAKKPMDQLVQEGLFRQDLYYRLAVVVLTMPPLRDRIDDIPMLASHFATELSDGKTRNLPPDVIEQMLHHPWHGNVRELRNAVQRLLTIRESGLDTRGPGSPSSYVPVLVDYSTAREQALRRFHVEYLATLWARHEGNLSAAARAAQMDRKTLRQLLRKYGLYR